MPDDDNEATEMVEAYGQRLETALPRAHDGLSRVQFADFLLKFIVIGWKTYLRIYCIYRLVYSLLLSGEAGTGKSCLLHHFIQNSCA